MTKKGINRVLTLVSGLLFSLIMSAQTLPLMPSDPAIMADTFPNGMTCYVAANPFVKGFADCAVVRRSDQTILFEKHDLITLSPEQVDSALLTMVRAVAATGCPAEYALVAAGDLDAAEVMMKVRYMSLMVNAGPEAEMVSFDAGEQTAVSFREIRDEFSGMASITAVWTSPRTPEQMMNTTQKAIYDKSVYEFGHIACDRLRARLEKLGIEVHDLGMNHRNSLDSADDEEFEVYVKVYAQHSSAAAEALKETLGAIDAHGAYASELRLAEIAYLSHLSSVSVDHSNASYLKRCMDAYIYNAPLTSPEGLIGFHQSKNVPDGLRESVFAGISSALLDMEPGAYQKPEERYIDIADTLALSAVYPKAALRSFRKDHMSGGVMWTFLNGFKVVYKKMPTNGRTYYSLAMNGGYASQNGRTADDGYVCGMSPEYFYDMLQLAGVTMSTKVNYSNVMISGEAQEGKIDLMMKSLLAVANARSSSNLLVMVSDMDEYKIRRQLAMYVGGFQTRKSVSRRANSNSRAAKAIVPDNSVLTPDGVVLETSLIMPVTLENCVAADMAEFMLEHGLMNELAHHGVTVDVSHAMRIYPEGNCSIKVEIRRKDGGRMDPDMFKDIREAISRIAETPIEPELMEAVRLYVKHNKVKEKETPAYWLHAIALRYLDGKDYTSGYESMTLAVSPTKVNSLLSSINEGFRTSYRKINL